MGQYVTALLATFTNDDYLDFTVKAIYQAFQIENDRMFVFSDQDDDFKKIVTYNVLIQSGNKADIGSVKNTIKINRKKESNTLYTINSLNKAIQKKIGKTDPSYNLDWSEYRNTMMISDKDSDDIILIHTEIYNVIDKNSFYRNGNTAHPKKIKKRLIINTNPQYNGGKLITIADKEVSEEEDNKFNK